MYDGEFAKINYRKSSYFHPSLIPWIIRMTNPELPPQPRHAIPGEIDHPQLAFLATTGYHDLAVNTRQRHGIAEGY